MAASADGGCSVTSGNADRPSDCREDTAFYRESGRGAFAGASVKIHVPTTDPGMPGRADPVSDDTGFVYLEATPIVGVAHSEFGLQYSAAHNWYTPYVRSDGTVLVNPDTKTKSFRPGGTFAIEARAVPYLGGTCTKPRCFSGIIVDLGSDCPSTGYDCYESLAVMGDPAFGADCCSWAQMTEVARSGATRSDDGSVFGGIEWSDAKLGSSHGENTPSLTFTAWVDGGTLRRPDDAARVRVTSASSGSKTVTIDLHP